MRRPALLLVVPVGSSAFAGCFFASQDSDGSPDVTTTGGTDDRPHLAGTSSQERECCPDRDGDGWSDPDANRMWEDGADNFTDEPTQWHDTDGDGSGDNTTGVLGDICPRVWGNVIEPARRGCPYELTYLEDDPSWVELTVAWTAAGTSQTSTGWIVLDLCPTLAPQHVDNFLSHVSEGNHTGVVFHRVIDIFVIQGGDLGSGDGTGGYAARWYGLGDTADQTDMEGAR